MEKDLEAWLREISDDGPSKIKNLEGIARVTRTFEQLRAIAAGVPDEDLTLLSRRVEAAIEETTSLLERLSLLRALLVVLRQ